MERVIDEEANILLDMPSKKDDVDSSGDEGLFLKRSSGKTRLFDSDDENIITLEKSNCVSEEGSDPESDIENGVKAKTNKRRKIVNQLESDSEEDAPETGVDEVSKINEPTPTTTSLEIKDDFEAHNGFDEEEFMGSVSYPKTVAPINKSPLKANLFSQSDLYDAEGSSDEDFPTLTNESNDEIQTHNIDESRNDKHRGEKSKKSKSKSSKTELHDIHSESQRMVRESRVSLPYHRPRQRSLAEFLQRRKNTVLPVKSLKTSPAKLGAVWKTFEKKAKEAEEFYKSESDSEPENEGDKNESEVAKKEVADICDVDRVTDSNCLEKPSNVLTEQSDDTTVLSSETEKPSASNVDDGLNASVTNSGISNGIEVCNKESASSLPGRENIEIEKTVHSENTIAEVDSSTVMDVLEEKLLSEGDKKENGTEMNPVNTYCDGIASTSNVTVDNNHTTTGAELNFESVLKKAKSLTLVEAELSNSPKGIMETSTGNMYNETDGKPTEARSPAEIEIESLIHKNDRREMKVPSPPELEEVESMNLRLDEDTCDEVKRNLVSAVADDTSRTSNSMPATKENESERCAGTSLPDVGQTSSSEAPEHHLDRKDQLLKAAGIFLSPQVLPCLKADSDVIDLDEDVRANPKKQLGVRDLMQRFIDHHIPKKPKNEEKKVDIGIVLVEGGGDQGPDKVKKEVLTVTLGGGDPIKHASPGMERPGARLKSLREELQREIAKKRDEEWARRQRENQDTDEDNEDEEKCNLDDEEEEEMTESSSGEEEEEDEIEDDVDMSTKSRPKSQFVDDEAEESEDDGDINDDSSSGNEADSEDGGLLDVEITPKEKLIEEDFKENVTKLNEENGSDDVVPLPAEKKSSNFQRVKTFDLFCSQSDDGEELGAAEYLKSPPSTPFSQTAKASGHLCLPSPALPLTALQSSSGQSSPWSLTQKCLFDDEDSPKCHKDEKDGSKNDKTGIRGLICMSQDSQFNEDELLNLMSGKFLSRAGKVDETQGDDFSLALEDTQELFDKSQLTKRTTEEPFADSMKRVKEESCADFPRLDDLKTSRKESWGNLSFSLNDDEGSDSDNEDIDMKNSSEVSMRRKKLKKLAISDDEEDEAKPEVEHKATESEDEESSKGEDVEEKESSEEEVAESDEGGEEGGERVVEYDSEENAVVVVEEEEREVRKKSRVRRGLEFLENEAELSEEEYEGSGDEDERGLDRMEREAGDADRLDDEIVRRELGRIHMRQVLDEDKREVRLLQEIFLEDGELHSDGQGRERKFRWRNNDNMDDSVYRPVDSGDEGKPEDEDENEEEWRRVRHERETWLREHKKDEIEDTLGEDSGVLKLGQAALLRATKYPNNTLKKWLQSSSDKEQEKEIKAPVEKEPESPLMKRHFQILTKRGSFLARKDGTLERLAEIAIKSAGGLEPECLTSTSPVVAKTKNSRKFVFTVLSPEKKVQKAVTVQKTSDEASQPVKKFTKRKRPESSQVSKPAKKNKSGAVGSIFQFL